MTALASMAAPARPPQDARVPCPLCGGLIHPVAGRCKHCKEDLSARRAGRPQAAAPLPALDRAAARDSGQVAIAPAVTSAPVPAVVPARDASAPILPPRPTGRSVVAQPERSIWKSWPMIVIVLATIAIAVAVVIMVMPPSTSDSAAGKHVIQPPTPAPDRMDSNPLPPPGPGNSNGADPWGGHSQVDPPRHLDPVPQDPPQQLQVPTDPDPDAIDPFGGIVGGGLGPTGGTGAASFYTAALDHACQKLKACPDVDQTLTSICDVLTLQPKAQTTCASGQRCLDAIDKLSCTQAGALSNPNSIVTLFQDCTNAVTSC